MYRKYTHFEKISLYTYSYLFLNNIKKKNDYMVWCDIWMQSLDENVV